MTTSSNPSAFPIKIALAVATFAGILTVWHWQARNSSVYPTGLDWHSLNDVASLPFIHRNAPLGSVKAPASVATKTPAGTLPAVSQTQQPPDALLIDNAGSLDRFYASLANLDGLTAGVTASVVHFGDSPTTADLITGDIRQQLQQRFGDAGVGFNLIGKPWAWYQHRDIDETDSGWTFNTAVGLMREGHFGVGGVSIEGGAGATARYRFSGSAPSPDSVELIWASLPGSGTVSIAADNIEIATVDTSKLLSPPPVERLEPSVGDASIGQVPSPEAAVPAKVTSAKSAAAPVTPPQFQTFALPANTHAVSVRVTQGTVHLHGIVFERRHPGLVYHSVGLNGASITVLSRAIAKETLKQSFVHLRPNLVVINYGTNEASFASFIDRQYEGELRMAIARVHEAAPDASILLMSPMDRGERGAGNSIATMETIPKIVAIQQRVAADTGCAFFNTFEAMGGEGTMQRWYEGKPRMVGGDLIHPSPQGAKIVATAFVGQVEEGYSRYRSRIGLKTVPQPAATGQQPAPSRAVMGENKGS